MTFSDQAQQDVLGAYVLGRVASADEVLDARLNLLAPRTQPLEGLGRDPFPFVNEAE